MSTNIPINDEDSDDSLIIGMTGDGRGERRELLGSGSDDDDDFFLQGPRVSLHQSDSKSKLVGLKNKVDEVTNIMKENVNRVLERNDRLDDLQERSDRLNVFSSNFTASASALRRKAWWENNKAKGIIGVSASVILLIIIISLF
ncbi:VAMP4 [Lepeophtheirus salmonis]|uniref:VAMP4 n=1 Tax=Lepeophtheirus salmonis TaxID=72036 RepID=C1BUJ1_LEPSM|nr:vesicle-associated membrane protein 4-like [Lepeophtheirus salmonis]ACO12694.1 Vesicle-associated membrane protein 4 [Lepeophtheirus salmonis]ADD37933.1 Vesicle-associated membrane protein 4 [Lepeophtheirus salmonis]CAF2741054.1 VAMP4 [Lepeophtheirus salmonis]CAG9475415.1 VAMP4 [Lepeophtheirus salmonis]